MFIKKQLDSAILIGHSFGGAIVQLFLEQFPEKVEKMVLISSIPPTGMLFDMGHFALRHPWKFLKLGTINFRKNIHSINDVGSLFLSNKISLTKRKEYCEKIQKDSIRTNITTLKPIVSKNFNPKEKWDLTVGSLLQIPICKNILTANKTQNFISNTSMMDMIIQNLRSLRNKEAVIADNGTLSYSELNCLSANITK